jgi:hypothetical protein
MRGPGKDQKILDHIYVQDSKLDGNLRTVSSTKKIIDDNNLNK